MPRLCRGKIFILTLFLVAVSIYRVSGLANATESSTTPAGTTESSTTLANATQSFFIPTNATQSSTTPASTTGSSTTLANASRSFFIATNATQSSTTLASTTESSTTLANATQSFCIATNATQSSTTLASTTESSATLANASRSFFIPTNATESSPTPASNTESSTNLGNATQSFSIHTDAPASNTELSTTTFNFTQSPTTLATTTESSSTPNNATESSNTSASTTELSTTPDNATQPSTTPAGSKESSTIPDTATISSTTPPSATESSTTRAITTGSQTTPTRTTEASTSPASTRVALPVTCPAGTVVTAYGSVAMFEKGAIYSRANSTDTNCPFYTERGGQPIEAVCVGDNIRPGNWVIPETNCGMNLTSEEILLAFENVEVTADNAAIIAEELADITAVSQNIFQEDLSIVAELLEGITLVNSTDVEVTESVVEIANNIAALPDEQLDMAEEENSVPSRLVLALEAQLAVVEVENGSIRFVETNVAAEVLDVTTSDISQGYTAFTSVSDDGESILDEDFGVTEGDLTQEAEATQAQATLFIPSGLADRFSGRRARLVITTYRVPSLFQDDGLGEFNQIRTEFSRILNSRIISASINNEKVEDLGEPVRVYFTPLNPNGTNAQCVFWDFNENAWSQRGCVKTSDDSADRIECECNHLTNFGILMDIYGGEGLTVQEDFFLEIISYVGCCMSILGLVITILAYSTNKKLRGRKPNQILLSLSCSLLGLYIVFLVMISLDTERDVAELPLLPCSILAAFLHYFVLASIFWMGVEGYNMYYLFVRVFNAYLPSFMKKASLVAWGGPALIVGLTTGASRQYYAQTDFCFPAYWPLIGGLLIPIGVVMILNVVIFVRVLMRLNKTVKGRQIDKTEKRQRLRRFQNAVCILILMGLTWSVGYLSIIQPASAVVQGIFTVFNSLQGFFMFMLYCVRQPQVRMMWRSQFSCCLPKSFTTAANSTSGQTTSASKNSSEMLMAESGSINPRLVSNSDSSGLRLETVLIQSPSEGLPRASCDYDNSGAKF